MNRTKVQRYVNTSVIIVNRHSSFALRRCLGCLSQQTRGLRPEVIVVDDGSCAGTHELPISDFPSVVFIRNPRKIGFARASNLGAERAKGRYFLFLHPDVELANNALEALASSLRGVAEAGALGCLMLNSDGTIRRDSVRSFPTIANQVFDSEYLRERFPDSRLWEQIAVSTDWTGTRRVEAVSGACLLVRRECFQAVGGFTEHFSEWGADVDLCFRLRRHGTPAYFSARISVVQRGDGTTDQQVSSTSNIVVRESTFAFLALNRGPWIASAYRGAMAISSIVRLLLIPAMLPMGKVFVRHGYHSWAKWFVILQWSLGGLRLFRMESKQVAREVEALRHS